jgi:hypothetical protein
MPVILGGNTGIYLASLTPPAPAPALLLDTYTNAAVAFSLRKLRTAYTGAAIRVRRSSDNAEQDIGTVYNTLTQEYDLDIISMLDFVGYNLFQYSEDFSQTYWSKVQLNTTGTPPYVDVQTAPDGTLTGDKMIENTANSNHSTTRLNTAFTIGSDYNISVYLKPAERTRVYIDSEISGAYQNATVDLSTGSVVSTTFTNTPVITAEANGWYRFSVTINAGATSVVPIRVFLNNGTTNSYLGDGTSGAYVWGFQLTQSSSVKPYGKTTTDTARNGFITTWYDNTTNANHATQATATSQAQIVSSGNLILDADTSKISTTWTTDRYSLTTGISTNTKYLSVSMFRRGTNLSDRLIHLGNASTLGPAPLLWNGSLASYNIRSYMPTSFDFQSISTQGRCIMTSLKDSSNLKVAYRNGTQLTNTATEAPTTGTLDVFGQAGTIYTSGQYQEYIYWNSEQSANRIGIETNINTYWNAY